MDIKELESQIHEYLYQINEVLAGMDGQIENQKKNFNRIEELLLSEIDSLKSRIRVLEFSIKNDK